MTPLLAVWITTISGDPTATLTVSNNVLPVPQGTHQLFLPSTNLTAGVSNRTSTTFGAPDGSTVLIGYDGTSTVVTIVPPDETDWNNRNFFLGMALSAGIGMPFLGLKWFRKLSTPSAE